eukprot:8634575-Pyramimonas_sp.AAC.1
MAAILLHTLRLLISDAWSEQCCPAFRALIFKVSTQMVQLFAVSARAKTNLNVPMFAAPYQVSIMTLVT